MSHLDESHDELIQCEIDGEASEQEVAALRDYVAANADARSRQVELKRLAEMLNRAEPINPPTDLAKSVLAALPPQRHAPARVLRPRTGLARFPILKYGYALAAGLILGLGLHQFLFNHPSTLPATDVSGSMLPRIPASSSGPADQLPLNPDGVSGSVSIRVSGSVAPLEFDLDSQKPVQFEVRFDRAQVEFKGFNQQINKVDSFAAVPGRINVQCEGKQRFTVLLANSKSRDADLNIGVFISGKLVQSGNLRLPKSG